MDSQLLLEIAILVRQTICMMVSFYCHTREGKCGTGGWKTHVTHLVHGPWVGIDILCTVWQWNVIFMHSERANYALKKPKYAKKLLFLILFLKLFVIFNTFCPHNTTVTNIDWFLFFLSQKSSSSSFSSSSSSTFILRSLLNPPSLLASVPYCFNWLSRKMSNLPALLLLLLPQYKFKLSKFKWSKFVLFCFYCFFQSCQTPWEMPLIFPQSWKNAKICQNWWNMHFLKKSNFMQIQCTYHMFYAFA